MEYSKQRKSELRWGYTTGTCAAAASLAAAVMLLEQNPREQVRMTTPKGISLDLEIEEIVLGRDRVSCAVRKDSGDDPDVTKGILIYGTVEKNSASYRGSGFYEYKKSGICLKLYGGVGIGVVTKPGLACEVGKPAINPVPRRMIFEQVCSACEKRGYQGELLIEISAPGGVLLAEKTFNPKLGIVGGISVLGTSGIVEPMSETALLETIRLELRQKHLEGADQLAVTPGNYGSEFLKEHLGLEPETAVKCSNFIGNTIDMAVQEGIRALLLVGHGGKLIKVAAGIMNTHSSVADGRMEILGVYAAVCGADKGLTEQILEAVTVDRALELLEQVSGLKEQVMERVMERIACHLQRRAGKQLQIEAIVFTNEQGLLGKTKGAEDLLQKLKGQIG